MNRIYKSVCACLLAVLLLTGVLCLFTKGEGEMPALTFSSLVDGSFCRKIQLYFADTFPGARMMESAHAKLNRFYNYGESPETAE